MTRVVILAAMIVGIVLGAGAVLVSRADRSYWVAYGECMGLVPGLARKVDASIGHWRSGIADGLEVTGSIDNPDGFARIVIWAAVSESLRELPAPVWQLAYHRAATSAALGCQAALRDQPVFGLEEPR